MQGLLFLALLLSSAAAHYIFPRLIVNGVATADWQYVRRTDNREDHYPLESVTSPNLRCYDSRRNLSVPVETHRVPTGAKIGFGTGHDGAQIIFHQSVTNVYMARVPSGVNASEWDGDGEVWFKVHEIPAMADGGNLFWFPSQGLLSVEFSLPLSLPPSQYLVRIENIALHYAMTFGGAQFYISCAQIDVSNDFVGEPPVYQNPGPLVSIPGVYDGHEPGIFININHPIPKFYIQPGPPVWSGF